MQIIKNSKRVTTFERSNQKAFPLSLLLNIAGMLVHFIKYEITCPHRATQKNGAHREYKDYFRLTARHKLQWPLHSEMILMKPLGQT